MDPQKTTGESRSSFFRRHLRPRNLILAAVTIVLFRVFVLFPVQHVNYVFSSALNWIIVLICGSLVTISPTLFVLRPFPRWATAICLVVAIVGLRISLEPLSALDREFFVLEETALKVDDISTVNRMAQIADEVDSARYYGIVARIYSSEKSLKVSDPSRGLTYALKAHAKGDCAITTDALACAYMANGQKDKALLYGMKHPLDESRSAYPVLFENGKLCPKYSQRSPASESFLSPRHIQ